MRVYVSTPCAVKQGKTRFNRINDNNKNSWRLCTQVAAWWQGFMSSCARLRSSAPKQASLCASLTTSAQKQPPEKSGSRSASEVGRWNSKYWSQMWWQSLHHQWWWCLVLNSVKNVSSWANWANNRVALSSGADCTAKTWNQLFSSKFMFILVVIDMSLAHMCFVAYGILQLILEGKICSIMVPLATSFARQELRVICVRSK